MSNQDSLEKGFAEFSKDFDEKLDICVPCAGINRNLSFLDTSFDEHQKLIGVNVMGVYHTAQFAAKQMIANDTKKGSIVLVASIASYIAIRSQMSSAYCGTKGAVRAMCPPVAAELIKYVSNPFASNLNNYLESDGQNQPGNSCQFHIARLCEDGDDGAGK